MKVSIIIATRNRIEELTKTLENCQQQDYKDMDIHVVDDNSDDGTYGIVKNFFPKVFITRNENNIGSIPSRNILLDRVKSELIFGLDDDSRFVSGNSVSRIVKRFLNEPDLGLIEFQEQGPQFPKTLQPDGLNKGEWHITTFASNRYALRRSLLEKTGKFPDFFFHMYEEPDLAIRIWDAGYRCIHWSDIVVWHEYSSLNRNLERIRYLQTRNEQLSIWMRAPWIYLFPLLIKRAIGQIIYSFHHEITKAALLGLWHSLFMVNEAIKNRSPVRNETVRRCLLLNRKKVIEPKDAWQLGKKSLYEKFCK